MARQGALKSEIRAYIEREYYPLDFRIDDVRASCRFNETCQETVPQAIECFLESKSFEDAVRTVISLGGDSDTIGAITGAIAEAYYGIPDDIKKRALAYLDEGLRAIYDEWAEFAPRSRGQLAVLTKYVGRIGAAASFGEWVVDAENDGSPGHTMRFPWFKCSELIVEFEEEFYQFFDAHPEYRLGQYGMIFEERGVEWGLGGVRSEKLDSLDVQGVLALVTSAVRADRFCEGALYRLLEDGTFLRWLERLKRLEESAD